ncbi:universal stress protein [Glycomyces terrestris]|uniref:Universal stress protein n=1 Tax=Glycomyces terrestris TaxID=2493553 RepID=A0A426V3F4_9ACTN|nr:universal stress protein [Glycomyces terrestris]RRS01423.1 universal stress protein [Glycomyces terrestris]
MAATSPAEPKATVVGVDGSSASQHALEWAVRRSAVTNDPVIAVRAWQAPTDYATGGLLVPEAEWETAAIEAMAATVAEVHAAYPAVPVQQRVVKGDPAQVLVQEAANAGLLVVGSRSRGELRSVLLGSVSWKCVHSARCPVLVIRDGTQTI